MVGEQCLLLVTLARQTGQRGGAAVRADTMVVVAAEAAVRPC